MFRCHFLFRIQFVLHRMFRPIWNETTEKERKKSNKYRLDDPSTHDSFDDVCGKSVAEMEKWKVSLSHSFEVEALTSYCVHHTKVAKLWFYLLYCPRPSSRPLAMTYDYTKQRKHKRKMPKPISFASFPFLRTRTRDEINKFCHSWRTNDSLFFGLLPSILNYNERDTCPGTWTQVDRMRKRTPKLSFSNKNCRGHRPLTTNSKNF